MGPLGVPELLIIMVIIIVIFGVGRLPELGGALGKGIREFRKATTEMTGTPSDDTEQQATRQSAPAALASGADSVMCPSCSAPNPRNNAFCGRCGTRMPPA
jgi:sec-independent protein translocase protein TatA